MPKIIEYITIITDYPYQLDTEVNIGIKGGWQPLGGIAVRTTSGGDSAYYQAMVKYQEEK